MSKLMELIKQKKQAIAANDRVRTVKPPEGTSQWRILPRWDGDAEGEFWQDFGQHYIKDTKGQLKAIYVCTDKTFGRSCEVCEAIQHGIMTSTDDDVKKALEDARSNGRVLVNAIQIGGAEKPKVEILELSPTTLKQLLSIVEEWGIPEVLSLEEGRSVVIERTGKGLQTKYSIQISSKKIKLPPAVMKLATNLHEYVQQESVEQQRRALANLKQVAGLLGAPAATSKTDLGSVAAELDSLEADGTNEIKMDLGTAEVEKPAETTGASSGGSGYDPDDLLKEIEGLV